MFQIVRFLWSRPLYLLLAALFLLCFTGFKLRTMAQIRGWVPGAEIVPKRITDLRVETLRKGGIACWVAWDGGSAAVPGTHRLNLEEDRFRRLAVGDMLPVVFVRGEPYLRDSIFDFKGNFAFDIVLLVLELALVVVAAVRFKSTRRRPSGIP